MTNRDVAVTRPPRYKWKIINEDSGIKRDSLVYLIIINDHALVSYFVLPLSRSPHRQNNHGIGAIANVQNDNNEVAQPTPNLRYNCNANNGKAAERKYRENMAAPAAEAPYKGP